VTTGLRISGILASANAAGRYTVSQIEHACREHFRERTAYSRLANGDWRADELHAIKRDPRLPDDVRLAIASMENAGCCIRVADCERIPLTQLDADRNGKVDGRDAAILTMRSIDQLAHDLPDLLVNGSLSDNQRQEMRDRIALARDELHKASEALNASEANKPLPLVAPRQNGVRRAIPA
jgi:hypothetical protein